MLLCGCFVNGDYRLLRGGTSCKTRRHCWGWIHVRGLGLASAFPGRHFCNSHSMNHSSEKLQKRQGCMCVCVCLENFFNSLIQHIMNQSSPAAPPKLYSLFSWICKSIHPPVGQWSTHPRNILDSTSSKLPCLSLAELLGCETLTVMTLRDHALPKPD